jgi:hypothetical protein
MIKYKRKEKAAVTGFWCNNILFGNFSLWCCKRMVNIAHPVTVRKLGSNPANTANFNSYLAQLVVRQTVNLMVLGSNPRVGANFNGKINNKS